MDKIKIIVLAAGLGKRLNSDIPKVLMPLRGRPIISYLLDAISDSSVDPKPIIVVGKGARVVRNALGDKYIYVYQEKQLGTGHAVMMAQELLQGIAENILVLYGDMPFIRPETIIKISEKHTRENNTITFASIHVEDFEDFRISLYQFGRVIRDRNGNIMRIVELKDATEDEKKITEVNPSYFCFNAGWLWKNIPKLRNENVQKEYYLTDLLELAIKQNQKVCALDIDPREAIGVNTPEHLLLAEKLIGTI